MHACVHHCIHVRLGVCVYNVCELYAAVFMTVGLLATSLVSASACKMQSVERGGKEKETLLAQIDDYLLAQAAFST